MHVEYLRISKFRGTYYLLAGLDKNNPEFISQIHAGACADCNQSYIVIQPVPFTESLLEALHDELPEISRVVERPGEEPSIYVCDQETVFCSGCGKPISLPAAELLDADRTSFGRYAIWMNKNHKKIR
jgi:hypothetical protein